MAVRWSKILLVAAVGLLVLVIAINNISDYTANFRYVQHVLSMDSVFEDSHLTWRAVRSPGWQHLVYIAMIATEVAIALLCLMGSMRLAAVSQEGVEMFHRAKAIAIYGLTLGFLFWLLGFMVIGGEWFTMWQSSEWNVQAPAFRFLGCVALVLIYLTLPNDQV
jgi:predicted small integral membrane protein